MKREAEFLKKVRELATNNNMSAAAKALKIHVYLVFTETFVPCSDGAT